jgi:post-segregation antitoxin (ccd killing protein)
MPNKNVYIPVELLEQIQTMDLNVSAILQEALRREIELRTKRCTRCNGELPRES